MKSLSCTSNKKTKGSIWPLQVKNKIRYSYF